MLPHNNINNQSGYKRLKYRLLTHPVGVINS